MQYYMTLCDGRDHTELKTWGPLPWRMLEKVFPEVELDEHGEPTEFVKIEAAAD